MGKTRAVMLGSALVVLSLPLAVLLGIGALFAANVIIGDKATTNDPVYIYGPDEAAMQLQEVARNSTDTYPKATKEVRQTTANPSISDDPKVWEREIWPLENSRQQMHAIGPSQHRPIRLGTPQDPFRILIVGDSYSSGSFHDITDSNYTRRLEQKLNQYAPGAYEIVTLATDWSSFLRQSDWVTEEAIRDLNPDAVILTYTFNRIWPSFLENKYCVEFNTCIADGQNRPFQDAFAHDFSMASLKWKIIMCLRADDSPVSWVFRKVLYPHFSNVAEYLAPRYCTTERVKAGLDLPTERSGMPTDAKENPYIGDFEEYLSTIRNAIDAQNKPIPTHVMNLAWMPDQMWPPVNVDGVPRTSTVGYLFDLYRQYGFEEIPGTRTREAVTALRTWELGDIQGTNAGLENNNCVYNCTLSEEQWQRNKDNYFAGAINHPLKYRPGWALQDTFAQDILAFITSRYPKEPSGDPYAQALVVDYTPWNLHVSNSGPQSTVQLSQANSQLQSSQSSSGQEVLAHTSCAATNHPHAVIALNQARLARASELITAYTGGQYKQLLISYQEEQANGKPSYRTSVLLSKGEYFTLKQPQKIRTILVSDPTRDCSQSPVKLDAFEISIELR